MILRGFLAVASFLTAQATLGAGSSDSGSISVRTEQYPCPPYSGATYYVYERRGVAICTKLEVCNKFDDCHAIYHLGAWRAEEDLETGDPYGASPPTFITPAKLRKHVCLVRYKLIGE